MREERWAQMVIHSERIKERSEEHRDFVGVLFLECFDELKRLRDAGHGAERAVAERIRQKSVEGWTPEHDAEHDQGELAIAAACYALNKMPAFKEYWRADTVDWWPWHPDWDKRKKHDRERSLEIAAALIMAELDRIQAAKEGK